MDLSDRALVCPYRNNCKFSLSNFINCVYINGFQWARKQILVFLSFLDYFLFDFRKHSAYYILLSLHIFVPFELSRVSHKGSAYGGGQIDHFAGSKKENG